MADVAAKRNTKRKLSPLDMTFNLPVKVGTTIYQGTMVGTDAAGDALKASDALCVKVWGVACKNVIVGVSGDRIDVETGIHNFTAAASTAAPVDADRGFPCYVVFDGTVTNDASGLFAGMVEDVDSDGVNVMIAPWLVAP